MKKIPFLFISALFCAFYVGAETLPVAPFLPAQEQSAPKDTPITVQYPYEKMTVSRGAKEIFLSGQVNVPTPFTLDINGQEVPVHHNGAFVAFLPIQNGDFQFLLTVKTPEATYQAVRNITVPGTAIKDFSAKAQFDKEEIFPQHPVEVLPGDTLDLYARGTPDAQVTATLSGIKDAKDIPLTQSTVSPGVYRAHYTLSADQKAKNVKVTYRMKQGPKDSSAKISAPEKIKILGPKEALRTARITSPGVKLRKIPTPRENLYPFYRAYGQVYVTGRRNSQYRIRLNENETAWLEMDKLQLIRTSEKDLPIRELTQTTLEGKTRLVFQLGKEVPISVHEFSNRLELAFYYAEGFEENFSLDVSDPLVDQVVWSQPAQNTVLFKIYFKPDTQLWGHAYNFENGNLVLDLIHRPQLTANKEKPLAGARILLDAGHSPKRTVPYDGAIGPTGYLEYEATLALAEELKPLLEKQGATVLLTRQGNNHMTLQDRYQYALKEQAHVFISLHYNALPETANPRAQARGYSVYYNYPHSVKLAEAIYRSFTRQVPLPDNGMIADDILFIPRIPHLPSILVENAYLILPEQEEMAKDPLIRHQFVQALYEGILDFYGIAPAIKPKKQPAKRQPFQKPLKQTYLRAAKPPVLLPGKK